MFTTLKQRLFRKEYESLRLRESALDSKVLAFELKARALEPDVVKATRELLKGFDLSALKNSLYANEMEDVLLAQGGEAEQLVFLSKIKDVYDNKQFQSLMDYIVCNQVLYSFRVADNLGSMNFGRATVNGVSVVKDEIERLTKIYRERTAPVEAYDDKKII